MTSQSWDRAFNFMTAVGAAMLMIPLCLIFLGGTFPHSLIVVPFAAVFATVFGYAVQWLFAALTGKQSSRDGFDSLRDGVLGRFRVAYAAVPLLIDAAASVGVFFLFDGWLYRLAEAGTFLPDDRLVHYTVLYGLTAAGLFFAAAAVGCVIWFYPIERLASIYTLIGGCALFCIECVFLAVTARAFLKSTASYTALTLGIPFAVFFVCVLVIYNQSNLQRKFRGSVVSEISGSERRYSLLLVGAMILCFAVGVGLAYVVVAGIVILLRMLLYIILFRLFHDAENTNSYKAYDYVDSEEAGQMFRRNVMSPENQYIVAVFILVLFFAAMLVLALKTGILKKFIAWLREFIDTVIIGSGIIRSSFDPNADEGTYNYRDERRKIQNAGIRNYEAMASSTDTYRLFLQRLGRLRDYDEQLCYAYAVLLKTYKKMNIPLRISDTPRENRVKIEHALAVSEIERITADFESVRYAGRTPDEREAAQILSNICEAVKRYLF